MGVTRVDASWGIPIEINTDKSVEIFVDRFSREPIQENTIRIVVMEEPISVITSLVVNYPHCYDYVLTYQKNILENNPKARFFRGIQAWVNADIEQQKKFCVSTVVGWKRDERLSGYSVRHELWDRQKEIKIPKNFYLSKNYYPPGVNRNSVLSLGDNKAVMFDCMYHVAIENMTISNYFSEKIIDCFLTATIPVYRGALNIENYFNIGGIYVVDSVNDIISVCNKLTKEDYNSKINEIMDNYNRALCYRNYSTQLRDTIVNILNNG